MELVDYDKLHSRKGLKFYNLAKQERVEKCYCCREAKTRFIDIFESNNTYFCSYIHGLLDLFCIRQNN